MSLSGAQRIFVEGTLLTAEYRMGHIERVARIVKESPEDVERDIKVTSEDGITYRLGWVRQPGVRQSRRIAWAEKSDN